MVMRRFFGAMVILLVTSSAFTFCLAQTNNSTAPESSARNSSGQCENAQEHFVTVNGLRVHYIETGSGPAVVLIHGNAGSVEDFSYRTIPVLCSEYRIVAIDRPGHGKSDRPSDKSARLESQAALLHDTLGLLGIKRPILVGHSWGGSLALAYAIHYPNEVASLVLVAPAAYAETEENWWWMTAFVKPPVIGDVSLAVGKLFFGHSLLKSELKDAFYPQTVPDDYLKSASSSWLGHKQLKSYLHDEWKLNSSLKTLSQRYSEIRVPVVIVTGDADKVTPPKGNAYPLKAAISQSQLLELKNTGHEIPLIQPQSIRDALALVSSSAQAMFR